MKSWWSYPTIVLLLMVHCTAVLVHAGSIFCDDSELCLSKRFLRFGRALRDDPYYRISRQFYRLGRGYQPYQDKRFLRFGRSQQLGANDVYDDGLLQLEEPYSRKRRSLDTDSQSQFTHDHVKRSADQSEHEQIANDETSKAIRKRAIDDDMNSGDEVEKRFMRFGRDFSRNNNEVDKRFMRFGKRFVPVKKFMRFGRNNRFGNDFLATASKRFMRFGKRQDDGDEKDGLVGLDEDQMHKVNGILTLANQLSSESEQKNGLYGMDKRFMRFGKREAKTVDMQRVRDEKELIDVGHGRIQLAQLDSHGNSNGLGDHVDEDSYDHSDDDSKVEDDPHQKEKKEIFMRFGKQDPFLRFGKRQDPFLRFGKRQDPFLRFGKRQDPFLRFGKRQDPFLRFGRGLNKNSLHRYGRSDPFLRFGKRQDPFLRFGKRQDPFLRFGRGLNKDSLHRYGRSDPFLRFGKSTPYLRFGRQDPFLRFGRQDPFLRFGKRPMVDENEGADHVLTQYESD